MKKLTALALICLLTLYAVSGLALEDLVGKKAALSAIKPVLAEDIHLGEMLAIPGYAEFTPRRLEIYDHFVARQPGVVDHLEARTAYDAEEGYIYQHVNGLYYRKDQVTGLASGDGADFVCLFADLLNATCCQVIDYGKRLSVKAVFDGEAEYPGWVYQRNILLEDVTWIDPADNFAYDSCFTGYYVFGCALPNAVLDSEKPLRLEITVGDTPVVYHIRK